VNDDWRLTVRQALPRVFAMWHHMRPTYQLESLGRLTVARLSEWGIHGVIWDVDGTLMAHHGHDVDASVANVWNELTAAPQLRHSILSNCGEQRFRQLGAMFPRVTIIKGYAYAGGTVFRTRVANQDTWHGAPVPPPDGLVPLRKPNRELVACAVRTLECRPEEVVMIGDQYFTDIAGAGAAGVRSIKVPTIHRASFPLGVRMLQRCEAMLVWLAGRHRGE
jgi:predicted HAD superfamily phosphohydrolase YqeG